MALTIQSELQLHWSVTVVERGSPPQGQGPYRYSHPKHMAVSEKTGTLQRSGKAEFRVYEH